MNAKEKEILRAVVDHPSGLLSPAELINNIAKNDRRSVENLVVNGYIEEVPQDKRWYTGNVYSMNFYRATEKGRVCFESFFKRIFYNLKTETALYVGIASIIFGLISSSFSWATLQTSLDSNKISQKVAQLEYDNSQPFVIISGGNEDATTVDILNAGNSTAKNIFFLKFSKSSSTSSYFITLDKDIGLALGSNGKGVFNLNSKAMAILNTQDVKKLIPCLPIDFFSEDVNWVAVFYENSHGERFVNKFYGSASGYKKALDTNKLTCL